MNCNTRSKMNQETSPFKYEPDQRTRIGKDVHVKYPFKKKLAKMAHSNENDVLRVNCVPGI